MATKKRKEQLERLLEWEREGRLPKTKKLFNRKISDTLTLSEIDVRSWQLQVVNKDHETNIVSTSRFLLKHETLVQLGLTILDAVKQSEP